MLRTTARLGRRVAEQTHAWKRFSTPAAAPDLPPPTSLSKAQALSSSRIVLDFVRLGVSGRRLDALAAASLVGEYAGELVPLAPGAPLDAYSCRYPTRVPAALVSARAWGNAMRLVNHAPRARANAAFEYVHHGGLLRVVIVATRDVAPGEQILADYGPDYWRAHGDAPVVDLGPAASPA